MATGLRKGISAVVRPSVVAIVFSIVSLTGVPSATAQGFVPTDICPDPMNARSGTIPPNDPDGAEYVVCVPAVWSGDVVVFSHGTVRVTAPPGKIETIENQLEFEGVSLPGLINSLGGVFAVVARSDTGFSDVESAEKELISLVDIAQDAATDKFDNIDGFTFLVGVSQGGLFATKLIEENPDLFDGGLVACAPIGSILKQITYWGNLLVVLDFFFPKLNLSISNLLEPGFIPVINPIVLEYWENRDGVEEDGFQQQIRNALLANPNISRQIMDIARVAADATGQVPIADSILDPVETAIFIFGDAIELLGGNPFRNQEHLYSGSDNDFLFNIGVRRFAGDHMARREVRHRYGTTGALSVPLVSLHTDQDPIVPVWHEPLYVFKNLLRDSAPLFSPVPISRYGHCAFRPTEALAAFVLLVLRVEGRDLVNVETAPTDMASRTQFRALRRQFYFDGQSSPADRKK